MSDWQTARAAYHETIEEALKAAGVTMETVFIPYSQSRNANSETAMGGRGETWLSLNWKVTIKRNGRDVLTTDYSAGIAHAPSHQRAKAPLQYPSSQKNWLHYAGIWEAENGYAARLEMFGSERHNHFRADKAKPILPLLRDVMASMVADYGVLNYARFEDWANEYGYDPDSRSGEKVYRACMELALQMRAAFGDKGMEEFAELYQDY